MRDIGKWLVMSGALLLLTGGAIYLMGRYSFKLPGDLFIQGKRVAFYFPIVSCLVISALLSLLLHFFRR
jgi:hypothetical protein